MNEHLRQALKEQDTVLFIGSGISCWAGLPSWAGMLHKLADYLEVAGRDFDLVRKEIKQDLLQAASYGFDQLTRAEIGEFMRNTLRPDMTVPHDLHHKIVTLGPRCFITTNYDRLIEDSIRIWHPHRPLRVVTNRQPFETAEIIQARTIDFVFKPHGDIGDLESIVLTREQYRKLLDEGEWKHAIESLKTLLVTRRVVYLGFGLRDPDFLLIRDTLANTWKGGTRDHYAVMADVGPGEISYWRKNYGIHLFSYQTSERSDGSRGHSNLSSLLDALAESNRATATEPHAAYKSTRELLALLRHANGLMRIETLMPEFPLRVHLTRRPTYRHAHLYPRDEHDRKFVEDFLVDGPHRAILIGLPGSGKTYRLRKAAARLAQTLHGACLTESFSPENVVVPMFADLKLYSGSLSALLDGSLPAGLNLVEVVARYRVRIFLDSFNEMPRERWDSGAYEVDFIAFLQGYPKAEIVIGSRTEDGLEKINFPAYSLEEIEPGFVKMQLEMNGVSFSGRFENEIFWLLQKPFYFQLVISGRVQVPTQPHPRDLYHSLFAGLSTAFVERFGCSLDLERALGEAAYEAINRGEEAQPVKNVIQSLRNEMQAAGVTGATAEEISSWLISKNILLPYSGARVSFFHQSVTEFLAATELARRHHASPNVAKSKLALKRWDQAMFLTLSLMPSDEAAVLLSAIVDADFALALNAVKYLEIERDETVAKLLNEIPKHTQNHHDVDWEMQSALEFRVPVSDSHEPQLRALLACGNSIGAAAAVRLLELKGTTIKSELLATMLSRRSDFNYCTKIGRSLAPLITEEDLEELAAMAASAEPEMTEDVEQSPAFGLIAGIAELMTELELSRIADAFIDRSGVISPVNAEIMCDLLDHRRTSEALELAGQLLIRGVDKAATAIYFISEFSHEKSLLRCDFFDVPHLDRLISLLEVSVQDIWGLRALRFVCEARPDLAEEVRNRSKDVTGAVKVALLYAANSQDGALVFKALEELAKLSYEEVSQWSVHNILAQMTLNWTGYEELFVRLLRVRSDLLAWGLCESVEAIGEFEIGPIDWWLEWFDDEQDHEVHWWFRYHMSAILAKHLSLEARDAFLAEFNRSETKYRPLLARTLMTSYRDLTTDQFSSDAVSFLLEGLATSRVGVFDDNLLAQTATETFVEERLLPLLPGAADNVRSNLLQILQQAGSRHGRRYLTA